MARSTKSRLIRMAYANPQLRAPLLKELERVAARQARGMDEVQRLLQTPKWWQDTAAVAHLNKLFRRHDIQEKDLRAFYQHARKKAKPEEANQLRALLGMPELLFLLTEEQNDLRNEFAWLYPHLKDWQGYHVDLYYETWDEEALEIGETDYRYEEDNGEEWTLEEVVDTYLRGHSWEAWSSSPPSPRDWLLSQTEEGYHSGERTEYHAFITRVGGKKLTREEMQYISDAVNVRM